MLREVFKKTMKDPIIKEEFNKLGIEPAYADREEFFKNISETNKLTGDLLEKTGLVK
ncbi:tripartite-type tricarboxylate transporter receptor subunit TctC [Peribacillus cavernae]|nr:tripartite-type tricarboxylate transporter receptor subunit TctC [Peribacillus cavernae]